MGTIYGAIKSLVISGGNTKYDFREALTPLWIGYARFLEIHRAVYQKHESLSGRCSMVSISYLYSFEDFLCFATKLKRSLVNKWVSFFIFWYGQRRYLGFVKVKVDGSKRGSFVLNYYFYSWRLIFYSLS